MKTWIVITEIFLLGLWVDDWGLGVETAATGSGRTLRHKTLTPTHLTTTFMSLSDEASVQQWYCPATVRPPPLRE